MSLTHFLWIRISNLNESNKGEVDQSLEVNLNRTQVHNNLGRVVFLDDLEFFYSSHGRNPNSMRKPRVVFTFFNTDSQTILKIPMNAFLFSQRNALLKHESDPQLSKP